MSSQKADFGWLSWLSYDYWAVPGRGTDITDRYWVAAHLTFLAYLPTIWILQNFMKNREAYKLKTFSFLWNLIIALISGAGAITILIEAPHILCKVFQHEAGFLPLTRAVTSIFAVTKAVEFGDTFLLVLRKRPLIFLHWYHHITVAMFAWQAMLVRLQFAHHFAFINLCIHAVMYFYYSLGVIIPRHPLLRTFRPYITMSQTLQMFAGMFLSWMAICSSDYLPASDVFNGWISLAIYTSYAFLFTKFYIENYIKGVKVGMTLFVGTVHILAAIGIALLWSHPSWRRLLLELLCGYAVTATMIFMTGKSSTPSQQHSLKEKSQSSSHAVVATDDSMLHSLGRVAMMILNCTATWAREHHELKRRHDAAKELQKKAPPTSSSIIYALVAAGPNAGGDTKGAKMSEVLSPPPSDSWLGRIAEQGWDGHPMEKWLVMLCLTLPVIYSYNVYGDLFLGFCLHGCLRWVLELHTTGILAPEMRVAWFESAKVD